MIRIELYTIFLLLFVSIVFTACFDTTSTTEAKRDIRGQLIDSKVIGVEYRCGTVVDFTDDNGTFSCESLPISFYIGKIALGEVSRLPSDGKVFPQDIVGLNRSDVNNSKVLKLALLLQSLDSDGNASNGITIEKSRSDKFDEEIVVSELTVDELKTVLKDKDENIIFKDKDEVVSHLSISMGILDENNAIPTPTPIPSPTAMPMQTPTPSPTAMPTSTPIPTLSPIATPIIVPTITNPNSEENRSTDYKNIFINEANCSQIIDNEFIVICYDYRLKAAKSVAYHLYGDLMNDPNIEKRPSFYVEQSIDRQYRVSTTDYINSNYDRGHLAPDAAFDWSEESLHAVYTLVNIIPQAPQVNRNMWSKVEKYSRDRAVELGELDVINVIKYGKESKRIGKNQMAVSQGFYKVLYSNQDSYEECFYYINKLNLSSVDDNVSKHRVDCDSVSY